VAEREPSKGTLVRWCVAVTLIGETITVIARLVSGVSAAEYIAETDPPLILQIHHMFWAVPLLIWAALIRKNRLLQHRVVGIALGVVLSDLVHHFIVLPLWVGNTGWHWP